MVVPAAHDRAEQLTVPSTPSPRTETGAATLRVVLATAVVLAFVALSVLAGYLAVTRLGDPGTADQAEREEVMSQARQFMLRMGTYGPDLLDDQGAMPGYRDRVKAVITPKLAADFDEQAATAEQLVAQAGVSRAAEVFATGVSDIDPDSATALVAGTFTDTYPVKQKPTPQDPVPFRMSLKLVRIDGAWLVDDFDPVVGVE